MKKTFSTSFPKQNLNTTKEQVLNWASQFNICSFFDNNAYSSAFESFECLVAVGSVTQCSFQLANTASIALIDAFVAINKGKWMFGHIGFGFQQATIPQIVFNNPPSNNAFTDFTLFVPATVIQIQGNSVHILSYTNTLPETIWEEINNCKTDLPTTTFEQSIPAIKSRIDKSTYINTIEALQQHIKAGNCYEINFCQEFFAENVALHPILTFKQLNQISPTPFACYYKQNDDYLLCASPERYLKKMGNQLISQPIKGTFKRNLSDKHIDEQLKEALKNSTKNQSENVMVVDLVRNDLSRICLPGTVQTTELFGVYSFPQVHQMISTVEGQVLPNTSFGDILKATFPMGSMTGAPKHKVLELTAQFEPVSRGIYSGSVGYITPDGDFDFNVVIRSIVYNASQKYLSYHVGSGITYYSHAEEEYEECLIKAEAIKIVLAKTHACFQKSST